MTLEPNVCLLNPPPPTNLLCDVGQITESLKIEGIGLCDFVPPVKF